MQKPSIGRIVIYTANPKWDVVGGEHPAVITEALRDDRVALRVLPNAAAPSFLVPCVSMGEAGTVGTWRWPDRV